MAVKERLLVQRKVNRKTARDVARPSDSKQKSVKVLITSKQSSYAQS